MNINRSSGLSPLSFHSLKVLMYKQGTTMIPSFPFHRFPVTSLYISPRSALAIYFPSLLSNTGEFAYKILSIGSLRSLALMNSRPSPDASSKLIATGKCVSFF